MKKEEINQLSSKSEYLKFKIENFTYSLSILELDDGEISLMDNFYYNNKKLENIDSGESWGTNRLVKIWKENGEVFEFEE